MSARGKMWVAAGGLIFVVLTISLIWRVHLRAGVESYRAELRAKGEPIDLTQVVPTSSSEGRNNASLLLQAAQALHIYQTFLQSNDPSAMTMVARGEAIAAWKQPDIRSRLGTNSWQDLARAMEKNQQALALLDQITNGASFDFQINYGDFTHLFLLHLTQEKQCAQLLSYAATDALRRGEAGVAARDIEIMLTLVEGTANECLAISQLVRLAIAHMALVSTWSFLQSPRATDEMLASLQAAWARQKFTTAWKQALRLERAEGETLVGQWRQSPPQLKQYLSQQKAALAAFGGGTNSGALWERFQIDARILAWEYAWSYPDELRALKGYQALIATMDQAEQTGAFSNGLKAQQDQLDRLGMSPLRESADSAFSDETDLRTMLSGAIVSLSEGSARVMSAEAAREVAIAAIALQGYRLKHGEYPADLEALRPDFVAKIPTDPVDGRPLRYRRKADGTFLLYSIAMNGKDDGGSPELEPGSSSEIKSWENEKALDWVWPQPQP